MQLRFGGLNASLLSVSIFETISCFFFPLHIWLTCPESINASNCKYLLKKKKKKDENNLYYKLIDRYIWLVVAAESGKHTGVVLWTRIKAFVVQKI